MIMAKFDLNCTHDIVICDYSRRGGGEGGRGKGEEGAEKGEGGNHSNVTQVTSNESYL